MNLEQARVADLNVRYADAIDIDCYSAVATRAAKVTPPANVHCV
jgi:hypothetical protein